MNKLINKYLIATVLFVSSLSYLSAAENKPYAFGGVKVFNYGVTTNDLQDLNRAIVNLGFSSSTSSTDNRGYGFDLGFGYDFSKNFGVEAGYTNFGTLTINNSTTGTTTTNTLDITGYGFGVAGVGKIGDEKNYGFIKAGFHNWDMKGTLTTSRGSYSDGLGTGTDLMFSAGYRSQGLGISWDRYNLKDGNITSVTASYKLDF